MQACEDSDTDVAGRARQALQQLGNSEAQEELCRLVIDHNHPLAREIAIAAPYAPHDPTRRALFYFLTEQWEKYEDLDFDQTMLRAVYTAGEEGLQRRIAEKVERAGRARWVTRIVTGEQQVRRLGEMTDAEWETALGVLFSSKRWEELWQLVRVGPPRWGLEILRQMGRVRWRPTSEEERQWFADLRRLAKNLNGKEPISEGLVHCQATLKGHQGSVSCLAISPDGQVLASASGGNNRTVRLWRLDFFRLSSLPVAQTTPEDLAWVQEGLDNPEISKKERQSLEFLLALMRWHHQSGMQLEDASRRIEVGEFDIEIER